jgi:hypothetical protein
MRFTDTAQNEYRFMNGTDTHAPMPGGEAGEPRHVSESVPYGFSITNGRPKLATQ